MRSNAPITLGGFLSGILIRLIVPLASFSIAVRLILKTCLLGFAYLYVFDIVNQTMAVAEDKVNKPYRPIPSGMITIRGALCRWVVSWFEYPILSYVLAGREAAVWALLWEAEVGFCYVWPRPNNPVARNLFGGFGTFIMLGQVNAVVMHEDQDRNLSLFLLAALGGWVGVVTQLQEFHDVDGDRAAGKKTLLVVLGESWNKVIRRTTCGIFILSHFFFMCYGSVIGTKSPYGSSIFAVGFVQMFLGILLGLRVVFSASVQMDKKNYFYWLTFLFWVMIIYTTLLGTAT